jgi:hypothetical protein
MRDFGDLVEVLAVEGGAGVAGAGQRARDGTASRVDRQQRVPVAAQTLPAVVGDAVDSGHTFKGAEFAHDLGGGCLGCHGFLSLRHPVAR